MPPAPEASSGPRGLYGALRRALSRPFADRGVVVISLVLLAFSFDTGLGADDYIHKLIAQGSSEIAGFVRPPLDMYRFTDGPRTTLQLMREGVLEWWADPDAKLAFFRPLSSLTHYVDYTFWPEQPWLMHLHSLLWTALLFAGVLALYRELVPTPWICALATFFYALDDGRGWTVSWIAARNAVVATAISVWALVAYHRGRAHGLRSASWLSPLLFGLSLLAGEGALSIFAYLAAYALFLDRGPLYLRLLRLVPHAVVVVVWRAAYRELGYGVAHSGLYFDPGTDVYDYWANFVERGPILLFAQVGGSWSDAWSTLLSFPKVQHALVLIAIASLCGVGYALFPLVRRDALMRFAVFGGVFSVLPAAATFTADRLLTWTAIGASIALAQLFASYLDEREWLAAGALRSLLLPPLVLALIVSKAVIDPVFLPSRARGNLVIRDALDRAEAGVPSGVAIRDKRVVYLNPVAVPLAAYVAVERAGQGIPRAQSQTLLATADSEVRVSRVDDRTLRVQQRGGFFQSSGSRLLRNPRRRFVKGQSVALEFLRIEVEQVGADGRPETVLAHFDRPLEDASFVWRQWRGTSFEPWTPPPIGASTVLPRADFLQGILGDSVKLPIDGRAPLAVDPLWEP